jgi:hypothetical protein
MNLKIHIYNHLNNSYGSSLLSTPKKTNIMPIFSISNNNQVKNNPLLKDDDNDPIYSRIVNSKNK